MKNNMFPKSLPFRGGMINHAAAGRAAGSANYINHVTGQSLDLFLMQVMQVGPIFALGAVAGNEALGEVRVDHTLLNGSGPIQMGDTLIVGPLEFLTAGPRAVAAWSTRPVTITRRPVASPVCPRGGSSIQTYRRQPVSAPRRNRGTITRVAQTGAFGQVTDERNGDQYFVHCSQLQRGAVLRIGARVSFTSAKTPRGLSALEVSPA